MRSLLGYNLTLSLTKLDHTQAMSHSHMWPSMQTSPLSKSAVTSHDRCLKDITVISQDLTRAAAYDDDLETIEAQSDFETLMDCSMWP